MADFVKEVACKNSRNVTFVRLCLGVLRLGRMKSEAQCGACTVVVLDPAVLMLPMDERVCTVL
jgi:hypothetical protein